MMTKKRPASSYPVSLNTTKNQKKMAEFAAGNFPNIPDDVLQDLCSRFLINIPENEKNDMVRICFQIEQAHWYYIDFCRQEDPDLPPCGMKAFIQIIFTKFSFLNKTQRSVQTIYDDWRQYKVRVPVFGAILLDESLQKCLLVQGFHNKTSWGFPKGKVNKDEEGLHCAIREVIEEVGFDIKPLAHSEQFIENNFHDHQVRLYIVPGVDRHFAFKPNTRGEIKEIEWFHISHLPTHKRDPTPKEKIGLTPNNFFMVIPFVKPLRKWIHDKRIEMTSKLSESFPLHTTDTRKTGGNVGVEKRRRDEENRRQQKKEHEEKFKLMHRNHDPFRGAKENEDALKSMLGMTTSSSQPEVIRRLLSGTVQISSPEHQQRYQPQQYRQSDSFVGLFNIGNNASLDFSKSSTTNTSSYSLFSQQQQLGSSNSAFHTTIHQNTQRSLYTTQTTTKESMIASDNLVSNHLNAPSRNFKILKKPPTTFSNFDYSSPAFTSFKFDYKQIMSTF